MSNLQQLYNKYQQSPWLDNISRALNQSGQLAKYIEDGVRGETSNPTIFEQAITGTSLYDEQIHHLAKEGKSAEDIYWQVAKDDIKASAKLLKPVYDSSEGQDGFVSLEVSPRIANDTEASIAQARELWNELSADVKNLMIKIPATAAGIPAIEACLKEGININVTLLFSVERYKQVIGAYKNALQSGASPMSVASFFVSRIDTEIDNIIDNLTDDSVKPLKGRVAVAQAHSAYKLFEDEFRDSQGVQKLLWASTSTKNPSYDPLLYVTNLIFPNTINTLPDSTIDAINQSEAFSPSVTEQALAESNDVMNQVKSAGIAIEDVCNTLEHEGVDKFNASYDSLLQAISEKTKKM